MKIGLISTAVPLVGGGYRFIIEWLHQKLVEAGHEAEIVYLPYTDETDQILPQMAAFRLIRLDHYFDRIVTFRPPAHMVRHPCKIVWFIHHLRALYDLWQTPYCPWPDDDASRALRAGVIAADTVGLGEAYRLFTNSHVVGDRLRRFNGLDSEVLYPPLLESGMFRAGEYGDEIVCVCRMEHHKRQHLLVEGLALTKTPVRLRLCGLASFSHDYVAGLRATAERHGVADRLTVEASWITEEEKVERLEHALAAAYLPFDEDSYGYPTIEAAHAARCTITASDSGGVLEFVQDGLTGLVAEPTGASIAQAFDRVFADRALARRMGEVAARRVGELGIDWDTVVAKLTA